jgi:hypothetical protein
MMQFIVYYRDYRVKRYSFPKIPAITCRNLQLLLADKITIVGLPVSTLVSCSPKSHPPVPLPIQRGSEGNLVQITYSSSSIIETCGKGFVTNPE